MTFDEQVAALRGRVEPKYFRGQKSEATPEQWAARLAYDARRRRPPSGDAGLKKRARDRARYDSRREEMKAASQRYYAANRDRVLARAAEYRNRNRQRVRDRQRQQRDAEPEKYRARSRERYAKHRDSLCKKTTEYKAARMKCDTGFRLRCVLRCRINAAVRSDARSGSAVRDLGCSVADLKAHIERQFADGMGWHNWGSGPGTWQIDHIYPLAQADLTDRLHVLAVCNWRNLQPLWFEDNVRKGDQVTPEAQQLFDGLIREFQQEVCDGEVA